MDNRFKSKNDYSDDGYFVLGSSIYKSSTAFQRTLQQPTENITFQGIYFQAFFVLVN